MKQRKALKQVTASAMALVFALTSTPYQALAGEFSDGSPGYEAAAVSDLVDDGLSAASEQNAVTTTQAAEAVTEGTTETATETTTETATETTTETTEETSVETETSAGTETQPEVTTEAETESETEGQEMALSDGESDESTEETTEETTEWIELSFGDFDGFVWNGEDRVLTLDTSNLTDADQIEVEWSVHVLDENGEFTEEDCSSYYSEVEGDSCSIILHGTAIWEKYQSITENGTIVLTTNRMAVNAKVKVNGESEASAGAGYGISARESSCTYDYPEDFSILHSTTWYFDGSLNYGLVNSANPDGLYDSVSYTIAISAQQQWQEGTDGEDGSWADTEETVASLTGDSENGWTLSGDGYGRVVLEMTYTSPLTGEEESYSFNVYVNGDSYSLDAVYPELSNSMFINSSMEIGTILYHDWNYGDGNSGSEIISDYELEIQQSDDGPDYDTSAISAEIVADENGNNTIVRVSSLEIGGYYEVPLIVYCIDTAEDGTTTRNEVYRTSFGVRICGGYTVVFPLTLTDDDGEELNVDVGDTLDLASFSPYVEQRTNGEDSVQLDGIRWSLEYDGNCWTVADDTTEIPVLERIGGWDTNITLIAEQNTGTDEEENWQECGRQTYYFDYLEYGFGWSTELRGGDHTWVYSDEEMMISIDSSNLADKNNVEIVWSAVVWDNSTGEQVSEADSIFSAVEGDPYSVVLHGSVIKEMAQDLTSDQHIDLSVDVYAGGQNMGEAYTPVFSRDSCCEYNYENSVSLVMLQAPYGWGTTIGYYLENPEYPNGTDGETSITDMQVSVQQQWQDSETEGEDGSWVDTDETVISLEGDAESGWEIYAEGYGRAEVEITVVSPLTGETETITQEFFVNADSYSLNGVYPDDFSFMNKNSSMEIGTELYHDWYYSQDDRGSEQIEAYELEIQQNDDGPAYDTNLITAEITADENGRNTVVSVTSGENEGETDIWVIVYEVSDEDSTVRNEVCRQSVHVYVYDSYNIIFPRSLTDDNGEAVNVNVGETLDIASYNPYVEQRITGEDPVQLEGIRWSLEYDENCWTAEDDTAEIPVLRRTNTWGTSVTLIAEQNNGSDEEEDWQECGRISYWFNELDYSVWFANLRGDGNTYVYAGEDFTLSLDSSNLEDRGEVEIQWSAKIVDNGSGEEKNASSSLYTAAEDDPYSVVLHGDAIRTVTENLFSDQYIRIDAEVYAAGQNVYTASAGVFSRYDYCEYQYEESVSLLLGDSDWDDTVDYYLENAEYPDGVNSDTSIVNMQVTVQQQWQDSETGDEDGSWEDTGETVITVDGDEESGWTVRAEDYGRAEVEITVVSPLTGETETITREFFVNASEAWLEGVYPDDSNTINKNSSMEVGTELYHRWSYYGDDSGVEQVEAYELEIQQNDDGPAYDTDLITAEITADENGRNTVVSVTSGENEGETDIWFVVYEVSDEDSTVRNEICRDCLHVCVYDGYNIIFPRSLTDDDGNTINVNLGETLDLASCNPYVEQRTTGEDPVQLEGIRWRLEYDENCWTVEDDTAEIPVLRRVGDWSTTVALIAEQDTGEDGEEDWNECCRVNYDFDGVDIDTWFTNLRGDGYTWVYEDEELTLSLDSSNLAEQTDLELTWSARILETATDDLVSEMDSLISTVDDDPYSVVLYGAAIKEAQEELTEEQWLALEVYICIDGQELDMHRIGIGSRENCCDYSYDETVSLLPENTWWEDTVDYYLENSENPYGINDAVSITDMQVTVQQQWQDSDSEDEDGSWVDTDETVISLEGDAESGWTVRAENYGRAEAELTVVSPLTGETETLTQVFYVNGDEYSLDGVYPDDFNFMNTDGSMVIGTRLYHSWYYSEDDRGGEQVVSYELEFQQNDDGPAYDTDLITAEVIADESGRNTVVSVTSGENEGETDIWVIVYEVSDEDSTVRNEVYRDCLHVYVYGSYNILFPRSLTDEDGETVNVNLGETLDLASYDPYVEQRNTDEEPVQLEVGRWRLEYDENCWTVEDDTAEIPVLKRTGDWGTSVTLIAERNDGSDEDEDWVELTRTSYWFDGLNFDTWFTDLRGDNYTWVYADEELTLSLDSSILEDKGEVEITWTARIRDSETDELISETDSLISAVEDDPYSVVLHGSAIKEAAESMTEDQYINLQADISVAGQEVNAVGIGIGSRDSYCDYSTDSISLLPGYTWWFDTLDYYLENSENPYGINDEVSITDMQVTVQQQWQDSETEGEDGSWVDTDETVISLEGDEESRWTVYAESYGRAEVEITVQSPLTGETETITQEFFVNADSYSLEGTYSTDWEIMNQYSSMVISTQLYHEWYYSEDDHGGEQVEAYELEIQQDDDGNPSYDTDLITAEITADENGRNTVLEITSGENQGETDIWVIVYRISEEDGTTREEVHRESLQVKVYESYGIIYPQTLTDDNGELVNVNVGETLDIASFNPYVEWRVTGQEPEVLEGIRWRLEYDTDCWTTEDDTADLPVLKRVGTWATSVTLIEMRNEAGEGEEEDWQDYSRISYMFDSLEYSVWFENLRGDGSTWVYADEDFTLSLDSSNLEDKGDVEIQWSVKIVDNGSEEEKNASSSLYTVSEDDPYSVVLHGDAIKTAAENLFSDQEIRVVSEVYADGQNVYTDSATVYSRDASYSYLYQKSVSILKTYSEYLGTAISYTVENAENPWGGSGETAIKSVEVVSQQQWQDDGWVDTDTTLLEIEGDAESGWWVDAAECGRAEVEITVESPLTGEDETITLVFYVNADGYSCSVVYSERSGLMLKNSSKTLDIALYHQWYYSDDDQGWEQVEDFEVEINPAFNTDVLTAEIIADENGNNTVIKLTSGENEGDVYIPLIFYRISGEDSAEREEVYRVNVAATVADSYCIILPRELTDDDGNNVNVNVGETLDIASYNPYLENRISGQEPEQLDDVRWSLEYDTDSWTVADDSGEIPVLKRTSSEYVSVTLVAERNIVKDDEDNWEEFDRVTYGFDAVETEELTAELTVDPEGSCVSGETVTLTANAAGGSGSYTYKFLVYNPETDSWYKLQDYADGNSIEWTPGSAGTRTLFVDVMDSEGTYLRVSYEYKVTEEEELSAVLTVSPEGSCVSGETVTLTAEASGGSGEYTYKFLVYNPETGNWYKLQDYSSADSVEWITGTSGQKTLFADVKDSSGAYVRVSCEYEVKEKAEELTAALSVSPESNCASGETVTLTASASGGSGSYTYKFLVYNPESDEWYRLRDYGSGNSIEWTTGKTGTKILFADVMDGDGNYVRVSCEYEVEEQAEELSAALTVNPEGSCIIGATLTLTAEATGGSGSYTYKFLVYSPESGEWYRLRDYESGNSIEWAPGKTGQKILYADVMDEDGSYVRVSCEYEVKEQTEELSVELTVEPEGSCTKGATVTLTAEAAGGSGDYTYKFLLYSQATGEWSRLQDYSADNSCEWITEDAGEVALLVDVKDASGTVKRTEVAFEVTE